MTLPVATSGAPRDLFPPGPQVFPVAGAELLALDAAVRATLAEPVIVPSSGGAPRWTAPLERYLRHRLPAFERELHAERRAVAPETLAAAADLLGEPAAVLTRRLRPVEAAGRLEIPRLTHAGLTAATARLAALQDLAAPAAVVEPARRHLRAVSTAGWRPTIDLAAFIPDPVEVAATVDIDRWPTRPPVVTADVAGLVLLAARCAIGPATRAVHLDDTGQRWHRLGGDPPDPDPGPVPDGAVVVGLSVHDDTVERLDFALLPGGAGRGLLAVTLTEE